MARGSFALTVTGEIFNPQLTVSPTPLTLELIS